MERSTFMVDGRGLYAELRSAYYIGLRHFAELRSAYYIGASTASVSPT